MHIKRCFSLSILVGFIGASLTCKSASGKKKAPEALLLNNNNKEIGNGGAGNKSPIRNNANNSISSKSGGKSNKSSSKSGINSSSSGGINSSGKLNGNSGNLNSSANSSGSSNSSSHEGGIGSGGRSSYNTGSYSNSHGGSPGGRSTNYSGYGTSNTARIEQLKKRLKKLVECTKDKIVCIIETYQDQDSLRNTVNNINHIKNIYNEALAKLTNEHMARSTSANLQELSDLLDPQVSLMGEVILKLAIIKHMPIEVFKAILDDNNDDDDGNSVSCNVLCLAIEKNVSIDVFNKLLRNLEGLYQRPGTNFLLWPINKELDEAPGANPLILATRHKRTEMVKALCMYADVNVGIIGKSITPWQCNTPLIEASKNGDLATAKVLLDAGAKVNIRWQGKTALMWAKESNHTEMVDLLSEAADKQKEAEKA